MSGTNGHGMILVVDDNGDDRENLCRHLTKLGCKFVEAENGDKGFSAFGKHSDSIDIVITDVRMPVMEGDEMARRIQDMAPDMPIFVVTGCSKERDAYFQGFARGVYRKPVSEEDVESMIKSVYSTT